MTFRLKLLTNCQNLLIRSKGNVFLGANNSATTNFKQPNIEILQIAVESKAVSRAFLWLPSIPNALFKTF